MSKKEPMEVMVEDARLIFKNFKGEAGNFNNAGDRNFCLVLPKETADQMAKDGWNIKSLEPRDEGDDPTYYLPVAVSYKIRPPRIVMIAGGVKTPLNQDSVDQLDYADIITVDVLVRSSYWEQPGGKSGIKAYLKSLFATVTVDPLEAKYADVGNTAPPVNRDDDYQEPNYDD